MSLGQAQYIDPVNHKAAFRQAQALAELKQYSKCKDILEKLQKVRPLPVRPVALLPVCWLTLINCL